MDVITKGQSTAIFLCIGPFSAWWQPTKQLGDPSASLLFTSEKAVFCKNTQPPKFLLLTLLQVIYHQLLPVSPYKLKQVFWNAEVAFCIPCKYVSIIDQWRWKQLHGETLPHSAGWPLARFDRLASTLASWGSRFSHRHGRRRRWGRCRPRWLVDQALVMEALRPQPFSKQAESQKFRRPPDILQ